MGDWVLLGSLYYMDISTLGSTIDSPPGNFPFYQKEEYFKKEKEEPKKVALFDIPQGPGSRLDSDTVDGIQAVTFDKAGPNKLVATGSSGFLPASIIPTTVLLNLILGRDGVTTYQLVVENDGTLSVDRV